MGYMKMICILGVLFLAGCGTRVSPPPAPKFTPEQTECMAEVELAADLMIVDCDKRGDMSPECDTSQIMAWQRKEWHKCLEKQ